VLYGHEPNQLGIEVADTSHNMDLQQWLQERDLMLQVIHQHLHRAQNKMKHHADTKRSFR
jgi:hypothetical protein